MKEVWVKADPWEKALVTAALESGADAVIVPENRVDDARELGEHLGAFLAGRHAE